MHKAKNKTREVNILSADAAYIVTMKNTKRYNNNNMNAVRVWCTQAKSAEIT